MVRLFFLLAIANILLACSPLGQFAAKQTIPAVGQIDMLTLIGTEKTITDHVISLSSGKDCSAVNLEKGQYYCKEDEPSIDQAIYCYNTLGRVTCYTKPDPYRGGYQKLGRNQHNTVKPVPVNRP